MAYLVNFPFNVPRCFGALHLYRDDTCNKCGLGRGEVAVITSLLKARPTKHYEVIRFFMDKFGLNKQDAGYILAGLLRIATDASEVRLSYPTCENALAQIASERREMYETVKGRMGNAA